MNHSFRGTANLAGRYQNRQILNRHLLPKQPLRASLDIVATLHSFPSQRCTRSQSSGLRTPVFEALRRVRQDDPRRIPILDAKRERVPKPEFEDE